MAQYELKKAMSKVVLYVGLAMVAVGGYLFYKKKGDLGLGSGIILLIAGIVASLTWFGNRKDEMCPTDVNDISGCKPV